MGRSLHELINEEFGVVTRAVIDPEITQVGVAAAQLLRPDSTRLAFVTVNLSNNAIFLLPSNLVSATRGIRLSPNGGSVSIRFDNDFNMPGLEWFAVATLAGSALMTIAITSDPGGV